MNKSIVLPFWFMLMCQLLPGSAYCQKPYVTLIIDTLQLPEGCAFKIDCSNHKFPETNLSLSAAWILDTSGAEPEKPNPDHYPNFSKRIYVANDSCILYIPIDNEGGYLSLLHVSDYLGDTLRICSYKVYNNCLNDTLVNTSYVYKLRNKGCEMKLVRKKEKYKVIHKTCNTTPPGNQSIQIYGVAYPIILSIVRNSMQGIVLNGPPERKRKLFKSNHKHRYSHHHQRLISYAYRAEISLMKR